MTKKLLVLSLVLLIATSGEREAIARVGAGEEAEAPASVAWSELAPPTAPFNDPFLAMSYWEKDDLRTILKATPGTDDRDLLTAAEDAYYAVQLRGVLEHEPAISNLFLVDGQRLVESSYVLRQARISDRVTGAPRTEAPALVRTGGQRP